ncbi:hypothetical protein B0H10DRAFT_1809400, partial [Mycena sp. CBHHK59/15]
PCGFCGRSTSKNGCTITIQGGKASSSCPDAYGFRVSSAATSSASKPCTNVPMKCILCEEFHWKYNIQCHLRDRHPRWELTVSKDTREQFISKHSFSLDAELGGKKGPAGEQVAAVQGVVPGHEQGQKRAPVSPAGTSRHARHARTSYGPQIIQPELPSHGPASGGRGSSQFQPSTQDVFH